MLRSAARDELVWAALTAEPLNLVHRRDRTTDPQVITSVAEAEILLEQSRAMYTRHAAEVATETMFAGMTVHEGMARCAAVKHVCTENAIRAVDPLVEVASGTAYSRAHPFERTWRDVQAGRFMPFDPHSARELIGASALGVALAPEVDALETGLDNRARPPVRARDGQSHTRSTCRR